MTDRPNILLILTEQVDSQIGSILSALKTNGLEKDTAIIFTSDHGNMQGNHRLASKMSFYEESVKVPFLMKCPGHIPAGRVDTSHLVSTGLDLLPTCCDLAGISAPAKLRGPVYGAFQGGLRPYPRVQKSEVGGQQCFQHRSDCNTIVSAYRLRVSIEDGSSGAILARYALAAVCSRDPDAEWLMHGAAERCVYNDGYIPENGTWDPFSVSAYQPSNRPTGPRANITIVPGIFA